jgi:polyphosphate glucokinase
MKRRAPRSPGHGTQARVIGAKGPAHEVPPLPSMSIKPTTSARRRPRTLAIDIGGTGLKVILLDRGGAPLTARARVLTPRPATPEAVVGALLSLIEPVDEFERVSVGFPGVVIAGIIRTAPNLHATWRGYDLATRLSA